MTPRTPGPRAGYVNAHTHVYSGLAPLGMPAPRETPENFVQILERIWWRLDRALDERSLRAAARLYVAEALLHGTTTLIDHHESPEFIDGSLDVLADACAELGMRAVLCFGATERNGGRDEALRGLEECRRFIATNARPNVCGAIGVHASFTVSDETLREAGRLCRELETVAHVHVAEDGADVADAQRRGYRGPLERLIELDALPRGSIVAHGVHLDDAQVRLAERHGVWIVHNPRSNEGNRVGYAGSLSASGRVALGTDGYPSDLEEELQALVEIAARRPGAERGDAAALRRRLDGGRALAAERFGAVEPARAVAAARGTASAEPAATRPTSDPLARDRIEIEPGARGRMQVMRVQVGGRIVVEEGRLAAADLEAIRAEAREESARLWRRMESL